MSNETVTIEVSWPETLDVPKGSLVYTSLYVGNDITFYRSLLDSEVTSVDTTTSPATFQIEYDPQDLVPDEPTTTWTHLHASPFLMHDGKRLNNAYGHKITFEQAKSGIWKIAMKA